MTGNELIYDKNWLVVQDKDNVGKEENWFLKVRPDSVSALVPGIVQDTLADYTSGVAWYYNEFCLEEPHEDFDAFLSFNFTEYITEAWVNGEFVGRFEGRHLSFEFDCTNALKVGENLLAIRLVSPGEKEIEGYTYKDLPILHNPESLSSGGIYYTPKLVFRPKCRIESPVCVPDMHTGDINIAFNIHTPFDTSAKWNITVLSPNGEVAVTEDKEISLIKGKTEQKTVLNVSSPMLWSCEFPNLYKVIINLSLGGKTIHSTAVTIGFRELLVKDGWFFLNGKRILIKGSFGIPDVMECLQKEEYRKMLIHAKSMGLNTYRFHNAVPTPEQIELCNQIGILVICSHAASWWMKPDGRYFEKLYDYHLFETIKQNINHPAIVAWELINESHFTKERNHAVDVLQKLRQIDMTRMVFLGSGRWDKVSTIGSISNPFSMEWNCEWGDEDSEKPPVEVTVDYLQTDAGVMEWTLRADDSENDGNTGDWHYYPEIPLSKESRDALRTHSAEHKPFFISEFGTNSLGTALSATRQIEQTGLNPQNERMISCRKCGEFLVETFNKYGLDELYPFAEDLVHESYKEAAYQRSTMFDLLRANPKMAGFLYSSLAANFSALSSLTWFKDKIPYVAEAMEEGCASLKWCLLLESENIRENTPFSFEAVLASEDVLKPGKYPVSARIVSKECGCVWEHSTELVIPEVKDGEYLPVCFSAFSKTVVLEKEGKYDVSVYLERGGCPKGGRKEITVSKEAQNCEMKIRSFGISDSQKNWLAKHGAIESENADVFVVGAEKISDGDLNYIYASVKKGARALFLSPEVFCTDDKLRDHQLHAASKLPFNEECFIRYSANWAYRIYTVLKPHAFSKELPIGLLSDAYFDMTEPMYVYEQMPTPDEVIAVTLGAPYFDGNADETHGTLSAFSLGSYNFGKGKIVLNCFRILEEIESKNPTAGKLLMNILEALK